MLFRSLALYSANVKLISDIIEVNSLGNNGGREGDRMNSIEYVGIERLFEEEGVLAGEVLTPSGVLLFPSGLDLESLRTAHPDAVEQLRKHGVERVAIKRHEPITADEFQRLIPWLSPPIARLNPLLTSVVAHQMSVVYSNAGNRELRERGVRSLFSIGVHLSSEVRRIPQITLSLGEDVERKFEEVFHAVNVAMLAGHIAKKLFPMWPDLAQSVTVGALFHDIGKAFIVASGYSVGKGSSREERSYRTHPLLGEALLRDAGINSHEILSFVRSHHEEWDGGGFPDGLSGESIPVGARIVAVANAFNNLLCGTGEDGRRSDRAMSSVIASTLGKFDRFVVRTLLASIGLYPPGSVVELSDGNSGIVLETRERDLIRPKVLLMTGLKKSRDASPEIVDLRKNSSVSIVRAIDDYGAMPIQPLVASSGGRGNMLFRKHRSPTVMK